MSIFKRLILSCIFLVPSISLAQVLDTDYQNADNSTYTIIENGTVTDSTVNSTNTNNNNNVNTSTSTSTNVNTNTNNNNNVNTNNNTNINTSTSTNTNNNTNVNTSTSTSNNTNTNTNVNTNTSNSTLNSTSNSTVNSNSTSEATNTNNNTNVNTSTSNSTSNSTSDSNVTTDNTNRNENINKSETTVKSPPPSAIAPSIGSSYSQDLCTTGVSGAIQTQILGLSGGKSVRDMNCERIKLSKTLYDMGMKVAAVSTMCQDERVFKAMLMAGTPCPFEGKIGKEALELWQQYPQLIPDNALDEVKIKQEQEDDSTSKFFIGGSALLLLLLL